MGFGKKRLFLAIALGASTLGGLPSLAHAQSADDIDARMRKAEAEIRALQRQVFPGGSGRFFEPEVTTPQTQTEAPGTPSTSALTDVLARLDAIESQLARLTAQVEVNSNALTLLDERVSRLETPPPPAPADLSDSTGAATPAAVAPQPAAAQPPAKLPTAPASVAPTPAAAAQQPGFASVAQSGSPGEAPKPAQTAPTADRLAAVQAIAKPQTDDAGDDEYTYGFRLWDAGFLPEAEQQLRLFVEKYPSHWRTTYGRNLLGRALLDDGKPNEAVPWFIQNYTQDKQGARAPDSLLYLAEAEIMLNDTSRACIALAEFSATYPAAATGRLAAQYEADLTKVKCN